MYRTVSQIDSATNLLSVLFPAVFHRVQLPEASVEGRPVYALRMRAGGGGDRRGVLVVGGTHARELMNPDAIIELAIDLLLAHLNETGITYGGRVWSADDIKVIVGALDIWLLPCMNPDGRNFVMTADDLWRKNRRVNAGTPCIGVDPNRNADIVWGVAQGQTSCSPCADTYCGPSAFSEPEARNVRYLLDTARMVSFVDVHSFSELVLFPWGHATTQSTDPTQRFTSLPTGTCTASIPSSYHEYMTPRDVQRFTTVSARIVNDIAAVRGRHYTAEPSINLYPTTGTQGDYAYSRHIADATKYKTYGFTFETGPNTGDTRESFHPADPTLIKRDAKAAILGLMQQSVCAIELINTSVSAVSKLATLRTARDELLATTAAGREWIALFERVQVPLISAVMSDAKLMQEAADLIGVATQRLASEASEFSAADAKRAVAVLKKLRKMTRIRAVQVDLDATADRIGKLSGKNMRRVIESLMSQRPGSVRKPAKGKKGKRPGRVIRKEKRR